MDNRDKTLKQNKICRKEIDLHNVQKPSLLGEEGCVSVHACVHISALRVGLLRELIPRLTH